MCVRRPILHAVLQNGDEYTNIIHCLVDSGADWCMFGIEKLAELGLEKRDLKFDYSLAFAAGQPIYFATVTMHVHELGSWKVHAGFSEALNNQQVGMLGHIGFFDRFKVSFDHRNGSFTVDP